MIPMSDSFRYLNSHLTMKTHVSNPVHSANFELRRISSIRHVLSVIIIVIIVLSKDVTNILASAFVLSRLGYCKSFLYD